MRSPRTLLVFTALFALAVFVLNALPSTVILDDDSKIVSASAAHKGPAATFDLVLVFAAALLCRTAFGSALRPYAQRRELIRTVASRARAPPARLVVRSS